MQYERLYADPSGENHFEQALFKLDEADYRLRRQWSSSRTLCKPARCNLSDCLRAGPGEYLPAAAPIYLLPGGSTRSVRERRKKADFRPR